MWQTYLTNRFWIMKNQEKQMHFDSKNRLHHPKPAINCIRKKYLFNFDPMETAIYTKFRWPNLTSNALNKAKYQLK